MPGTEAITKCEEVLVTEVTPHIVVRGAARAAEWYERALGAETGVAAARKGGR
jgi:hypothetical protein